MFKKNLFCKCGVVKKQQKKRKFKYWKIKLQKKFTFFVQKE